MNADIFSSFFAFALSLGLQGNVALHTAYPEIRATAAPEVRAIYWTAYTAGNEKRRDQLVSFMKKNDINAVVIDVKDSTGTVFIDSGLVLADLVGAEDLTRMPKIKDTLAMLHENDIYTIARIAVFEDPKLAEGLPEIALKSKLGGLWRDWKGLAWTDTASKTVWQYNLGIAKAAAKLGFDEINFDYIRFPSDGNLSNIVYPAYSEKDKKTDILANFFAYVQDELKSYPIYTSVDLFGMTLWRSDGMSIGQRYQDAAGRIDFISPMVYPSHYPDGFEGFSNPADNPYEIVFRSLIRAKDYLSDKPTKIRPWLQDFDLGAIYDRTKIQAQMDATRESGGTGWMFWNASNNYTSDGYSS